MSEQAISGPAAMVDLVRRPRLRVALVVALLAAPVGASALRLAGDLVRPQAPQSSHWGFSDFRDAVYFPSRALLDGNNPYDTVSFPSTYPVGRDYFPPYPPLALLLHAPFALLPFGLSVVVYFAGMVLLTLVLARLILHFAALEAQPHRLIGLAGLITLCRPWQQNIYLGQTALTMVVAACAVLVYSRKRPGLAGLCLAVVAAKPTFLIPLTVLLLITGSWRPVLIGGILALLGTIAGLVPLARAAGGIEPLLATMRHDYRLFQNAPDVVLATSRIRIDGLVLLSRVMGIRGSGVQWVLLASSLGLGCWSYRRLAEGTLGRERRALCSLVAGATMLAGTYHVGYDLLLLCLPALPLALSRLSPHSRIAPGLSLMLLGLTLLVLFNYAGTVAGLRLLGVTGGWPLDLLTTLNSAALFAILVLCALAAMSLPRRRQLPAGT